jgi:glycine cleavage system aminomethyltransferase T
MMSNRIRRERVRVLCRYFHTCTEPGVRFGDLAIQQLSANPGYIFAEFSNIQQRLATVSNSQQQSATVSNSQQQSATVSNSQHR